MIKAALWFDFGEKGKIGPSRIAVLEKIGEHGSISAAARDLGITYKHAWHLVGELNAIFDSQLVEGSTGGHQGGGSRLTQMGRVVASRLRAIETRAVTSAQAEFEALLSELRQMKSPGVSKPGRGAV